MKNLKAPTILLIIISAIIFSTSCAKKGCPDANATNYSGSAKKDDGTCRYEGAVVIWIHDSSAQKMANDTIQSLTIYVDGEIVGSLPITNHFMIAPNCGDNGAVTITKDLFSAKTKAISYRVLDDRSIKRFAGVLTFNGNTCERNELIYFH